VVIQVVAGARLSTVQHAGMAMMRAPNATAAVGAWNRLSRGGRS
jgi:hypothetical protein